MTIQTTAYPFPPEPMLAANLNAWLREECERQYARAEEAERTVASIAAMLGWRDVPPRETLERDIAALKARAPEASSPSDLPPRPKIEVSDVEEPSVIGAGCGGSPMPTRADAEAVWRAAYVARMVERGIAPEDAQACSGAGDADLSVNPVEAADAELEHWDSDGDQPVSQGAANRNKK